MKTCLTNSGSESITQVPSLAILIVNMSPKRARLCSSIHCACRDQIAVCSARGIRGPGGRPGIGRSEAPFTAAAVAVASIA